MNSHKRIQRTLGLFLAVLAVSPVAARQESIVFDAQTGNYIITFEYDGQVQQSIYVPPNKINPVLKSRFSLAPSGDIAYRYTLKSGKDSRQNVESLGVLVMSAKGATISTNAPQYLQSQPTAETALALSADSGKVELSTPAGWRGFVLPNSEGTGLSIGWSYWDKKISGLPPGASQSGFGYESRDLPGVGFAGIMGNAPTLSFAGDGPSQEIDDQLSEIMRKVHGVSRPVAVPTFAVPTPFDAAALLERLRKHANTDLVRYKLIDPVFASQLDLWFTGAIDAAKNNNTTALRNALQELRRLLKQECADVDQEGNETETDDKPIPPARIAKLAARVLNFDLKYVGSRI
jgi:hypothetical protein